MTLSDRLRAAALDRAARRGEQVDGFVLEPDGVIDLRQLGRDVVDPSARRSGPSLPRLEPETEPIEATLDLTGPAAAGRPLWRRVGRASDEPGATADEDGGEDEDDAQADLNKTPDSAVLDLTSDEIDLTPKAPLTRLADVPLAGTVNPSGSGVEPPPRFDTSPGADRRTAACPKCNGRGQEDLFDRVSATSYFSCDDCSYMWQERQGA